MTCDLAILPTALNEWRRLDGSIRTLFKKNLAERLLQPHVPSAKLRRQKDGCKIRLSDAGYPWSTRFGTRP